MNRIRSSTRRSVRTIRMPAMVVTATVFLLGGGKEPPGRSDGAFLARTSRHLEDQPGGAALMDQQIRLQAASRLIADYQAFVRELAEQLRQAREAGHRSLPYGTPLQQNMELSAQLRARECTAELARMLTLKIDHETVPAGDQYGPDFLYPAARALVAIGDGGVVRSVLERMKAAEGDEEERLGVIQAGAWVLWKIHGEDMARAILRQAADASEERGRANLMDAINLIGEKESLLRF